MRVREWMTKNPVTVPPETPLLEALVRVLAALRPADAARS